MDEPRSKMAGGRVPARGISLTSALIANIALLTAVIAILCASLIALWGAQDIHSRESERLVDTARIIARQISLDLDERYRDTRTVRDLFERELADATIQQKREVLERMRAAHAYFSWLGVASANGQIELGTETLLEGGSVAQRDWFEGALNSPAFFGNLHPAKLLEQHIRNPDGAPLRLLDIALPLRNADGQATGVLAGHLNWRMIEDAVRDGIETSPDASPLAAAVVSADGVILYDTQGATGEARALLKQLALGQMIEATWPSERQTSLLVAAPLPLGHVFTGLDWRIVLRESAPAVRASITRMTWRIVGVCALVGLVFSLLGLLTVRTITRPLQALVGQISRFGETEVLPETSVSDRILEVRDLQTSFLGMAARVREQKALLRETQIEIVRTLGRAAEYRDDETGQHVSRMSLCCAHLGRLAGMDDKDVDMLRVASQMHDIGKIGIPDHVLLKPGRFDSEERAIMERHPEIGARILSGMDTPFTVLARTIALTHHEKWDGSGYPNRLAGRDIPLEGRIVAICDVFDALLSDRPYKQGWPLDKVVASMREQSGHHFDPRLLALLLSHLDEFVRIREKFRDEFRDPQFREA